MRPSYIHALGLLVVSLWGGLTLAAGTVRVLLQENRLDEATIVCRQFEVLSTADPDNFAACAWVYLRAGKPDSAAAMMERLNKQSTEYQILFVYGRMRSKQYAEARQLLNGLGPEFKSGSLGGTVQELTAELYELQGQLDTAAFIYKQLVGEDPRRARAHWGLGRFYLGRGDTVRARTHLEQTARLWPKHVGSRFNLGMISLNQDNLTDAARWLAECYKLDKGDSGVLEQLGVLFEKKGKIEEAIKYWKRALEINKDSKIAKEKLGSYMGHLVDSLIDSGQYTEALSRLKSDKLIKAEPKLLLKRGIVYRHMGKFDKGLADLISYTNTNPADPEAQRELGICYLNLKLLDQAATSFGRALEMEPTNGMNFAWVAFMLEQRGRLDDAVEAWRRAIQLLTEPRELRRATRKLASLERRLGRSREKQRMKEKREQEDPFDEEEEE